MSVNYRIEDTYVRPAVFGSFVWVVSYFGSCSDEVFKFSLLFSLFFCNTHKTKREREDTLPIYSRVRIQLYIFVFSRCSFWFCLAEGAVSGWTALFFLSVGVLDATVYANRPYIATRSRGFF